MTPGYAAISSRTASIVAELRLAGDKAQFVDDLRCGLEILAYLLDFGDFPECQGVAKLRLETLCLALDLLHSPISLGKALKVS